MNRVLARLRSGPACHDDRERHGCHGRRDRSVAALGRLRSAREGFDDSVVALRKAALDHVDLQDLASTALRANLERLAHRLAGDVRGHLGHDVAGDA